MAKTFTDYAYIRRLIHPNIQMNPDHQYVIDQGSWNFTFHRQERTLRNLTTGQVFTVYSTSNKDGSYSILD